MPETQGDVDHGQTWYPRKRWGWADLFALLVWTAAVGWLFWDVVSLKGAFLLRHH